MLGGKNPPQRRRERIGGEVVRPGARFSTVVSQRISPGIGKVASSHVTVHSQGVMPAKSDVSDFAPLTPAKVGQGRLWVKSDVSDFARLIAAEVGQGRLPVKAAHPVSPVK